MDKNETTTLAAEDTRMEMAMVTDLAVGSQIRSSRRGAYSLKGAQFPDDMTKEQLWQQIRQMRLMQRMAPLFISDALAHARKKFGEETQTEFIEKLALSTQETEALSLIATIPFDLRSLFLTDEHYVVLGAALESEALQKRDLKTWITRAEENQLTPSELEDSIKAGEVIKHNRALGPSGSNRNAILTIQAIGTSWRRFNKQLEERSCPLEKMDPQQKRQIFDEIKPIGEVYDKLKVEFGAA